MHHWATIDYTYVYDGSMEGLLTIAYKCFTDKKIPNKVSMENDYVGNLFNKPLYIKTDLNESLQVIEAIRSKISDLTLYYVYTAFLSDDKNKSDTIIRYLIYAFKHGKNINYMKSLDYVIEIQRICKNVTGEAHRFYGFLRFKELSNHILYAEYESDNDILEFLAEHFADRFKKEIWMIYDLKRSQIALYDKSQYNIVDASDFNISLVKESREDQYLKLWKDYCKNISIKERENRRCQMHFMPKKYWKHMPET